LPSVHEVLESLSPAARRMPHGLVLNEVRAALEQAREALRKGATSFAPIGASVEQALEQWTRPSLRRVINATGVVLHTNLGRAPLGNLEIPGGYTNLEYDLATGKRGKRDVHTSKLLEAILGRPAIAVNNNAAALFLVLNELASGGEAIVSRGELIEIGDGFRIPEIMQRSGAALREVGTTNRTQIDDYRAAIGEQTRVLLRVHPSNFRMTGFTARAELAELVALGRERAIPVYEDLGSGCLVDLREFGVAEPLAQESLAAGANLVSFSGDKLLGGPQAGIIAGDPDLIARVRRNPLFRALRQDKVFYQAMESTLRHILLGEFDCVPALRMIRMSAGEILQRAESLAGRLGAAARVEAGESVIGGGATPDVTLPTWLILIESKSAAELERRLRAGDPPVITRIEKDCVAIDLRAVLPEEEDALVQALS
jgi:L-seryl-tRNA(Ser) seleniumtransferase